MASSVENFDRGSKARVITSPRSIEACRLNGVDPMDLLPKGAEQFTGGSSSVPQSMIQRRQQHAEHRRLKILNIVRQTRQELLATHDESNNSPSTPRRRAERQAMSESPARTTCHRNKQNQLQAYASISEERRQRAAQKLKEIELASHQAMEMKSSHLDSIRANGGQRWESVWNTNTRANEINSQRASHNLQRHSSKEQIRRSGSLSATLRRRESWKNTGEQRDSHRDAVKGTYTQGLDNFKHRKQELLLEVVEKQELAAQHKEYTREYYSEVGEKRQVGREHAKNRATATEEERHCFYQELLIRKQAIMEDQQLTAEERKHHLSELFSKKNMQFMTVVDRGAKITAQRREDLQVRLTDKDAVAAEVKASLMMAQLEALERKRETTMDHVEDISRKRMATDYRRHKRYQEKVEECNYGHSSPRPHQ